MIDKEVVPQLKQINGVSNVWLTGGSEREIKINVDKHKLATYGIALSQITQLINTANLDFPTGKIKDNSDQITVRLAGKFDSVEQLRNLVVASRPGGNIRLVDVADVTDGAKDLTAICRFNGMEGVGDCIGGHSDLAHFHLYCHVFLRLLVEFDDVIGHVTGYWDSSG